MKNGVFYTVPLLVGLVIVIMVLVEYNHYQRVEKVNDSIRDVCLATEMYVIGNEGRSAMVYDCTMVEL